MDNTQEKEISLCRKEIGCEPKVLGFRLLIKALEIPEKIGGLYVTDTYKKTQERRQNIGQVLKIGPSAFTDRFEDRRCEVGDWIHYSILEREPVYANGKSCFYINDDKVYAIISPEDLPAFLDEQK